MMYQMVRNKFREISWQFKNLMLSKIALRGHLNSGITIQVENYADWIIYNDIFVDGEYDLAIKQVIKSGQQQKALSFLDVGANVGFFTLRVADLIWRSENPQTNFEIVLIEGSPSIYKKLESRLKNESLLRDKLKFYNGLVGERQGKGKIFESAFHVTNSIISARNNRGVDVSYINLMEIFKENQKIDLLKCDIEGAELMFIENYRELLRKKVKSAIFELHHDICNTDKCIDILKEVGFLNHQKLREASTFSVDFFYK